MTKQELTQLRELLEKFIDWMDDRDSKSVLGASSDRLAAKIFVQHMKNMEPLEAAKRMVKAIELNTAN